MRPHLYFALLASLAIPSLAWARPPAVYINGVRADGISGQTLTGVDVTFDDKGDIRITAKGYKISSSDAAPAPAASTVAARPAVAATSTSSASPVGRHFYIATLSAAGRTGMSQWDVDVYVNQVYVRKFRAEDPDPIFEITRFLKPGPNVIHFSAKKEEGERKSSSPADWFELVLGDGEMRAGQVMLTKITSYRLTAAETGSPNYETTLELAPSP